MKGIFSAKGYHLEDPDGFSGHLHSHCEGWACFHCVLSVEYTIAHFSKLLPESQWLRCPHMFSYHGGQEMAESCRMAESIWTGSRVLVTTSPQFTKTYQNQFSRLRMHAPSTKRTAEKSYITISSPTPSPADASRTLPALLPDAGTLLGTSGPVHQPYPSHAVRVESLVLKGITRVEGTSLIKLPHENLVAW